MSALLKKLSVFLVLLFVVLLFSGISGSTTLPEPKKLPKNLKPATASPPVLVSKEFLTGRFNYRRDSSFTRVPAMFSRQTTYLKKETLAAFLRMREAAAREGVTLFVLSGTRSFYDQSYKWESKWNAAEFARLGNRKEKVQRLLRWWSMPGTSRHHWGTDIDLTCMQPSWFETAAGRKMYSWMQKHASDYGFYQPFTADRPTGYREEKWHWSYVPLSKHYLNEYLKQISCTELGAYGQKGGEMVRELDIIGNWVAAVNERCK